MNNETRALTSRVLALTGPAQASNGEVRRAATQLVKCAMTFPRTLKHHLVADGHTPGLKIETSMSDAEVWTVPHSSL